MKTNSAARLILKTRAIVLGCALLVSVGLATASGFALASQVKRYAPPQIHTAQPPSMDLGNFMASAW